MKTLVHSLVVAGLVASSANAIDTKYLETDLKVTENIQKSSIYDARDRFNFSYPDLTLSLMRYPTQQYLAGDTLAPTEFQIHSRVGAIKNAVEVTVSFVPTFNNNENTRVLHKYKVNITGEENNFMLPENITIPTNIYAEGHYYINIEVDTLNVYAEINEHNNMANFGFDLLVPATINNFRRSEVSTSWTDIYGQINSCTDAYGEDARVASWQDMARFVQGGGNAEQLTQNLSLDAHRLNGSAKLFINHEGETGGDGGKYVIHTGTPNLKYYATLDSLDNHAFELNYLNTVRDNTFQDTLCFVPDSDVWVATIVHND
ncbi:MAG: hypothetical protein U9N52_12155 [Campylobacterota bacterium]|nr:hypothetical protein [Campylobacterota bacterium]